MLRPSSFFGVLFSVSSTAALACGGSVVFVDDGGEGGSGASGPTTSSSPTTTTKATTTTTTTTTAPSSASTGIVTPCDTLCSAPAGQCFGAECANACAGVYYPGCEPETDALILCYAQYLTPDCGIGSECSQVEAAYTACTTQRTDCQDFGCEAGGDYCDCYGQCFGTNLEQYCYATPNQIQCDCYGDFGLIGSCSQPNLSCSLDSGCCKQFFFDG
jgi:hypothetical protein